MSDKLKPCPFCGSESKLVETGLLFPSVPNGFAVSCQSCNACGHWDADKDKAVGEWNKRESITALEAELASTKQYAETLGKISEILETVGGLSRDIRKGESPVGWAKRVIAEREKLRRELAVERRVVEAYRSSCKERCGRCPVLFSCNDDGPGDESDCCTALQNWESKIRAGEGAGSNG